MFDIGWSEMMVVGAVALVVIGPKDLPAALRQAGKWMGAVRRMASDFHGHVNEAIREAELDELRREVNNLKSGVGSFTDPVKSATGEMRALVEKPALLPPPEAAATGHAVTGEPKTPVPATAEPAPPKPARKPAKPRVRIPAATDEKPARAPRKTAPRKTP